MAHLLVTGGAGYIGCHALRALQRAGHSAVVFDDLRAGRELLVRGAPLVRGDVRDRDAVARVFAEHGPFDGVLHFAALLSVPESVANPLLYYSNNVTGSAVLLEVALAAGTRAFVLSSTRGGLRPPEAAADPGGARRSRRSTPMAPRKLMVERMLADAETAHGLRWAALRYFNASGADPEGDLGECHDPETHLIPVALEAAAGLRDALPLYGTDYPTRDGTCVRDYIHVSDLATGHVLALEALLAGRSIGPRNLAHRPRRHEPRAAGGGRARGGAPGARRRTRRGGRAIRPSWSPTPTRFRSELGWQPRHSDLDTIVRTAWAWLRRWRGITG